MGRVEFFASKLMIKFKVRPRGVWKRDGDDDDRKKITPSTRTFRQQSALLVRVFVRVVLDVT